MSLGSLSRPIWPDIFCKCHPLRGLYNRGRGIYLFMSPLSSHSVWRRPLHSSLEGQEPPEQLHMTRSPDVTMRLTHCSPQEPSGHSWQVEVGDREEERASSQKVSHSWAVLQGLATPGCSLCKPPSQSADHKQLRDFCAFLTIISCTHWTVFVSKMKCYFLLHAGIFV